MWLVLVGFLIFGLAFFCYAKEPLKVVAAEHKLLQYQQNGNLKGPSAEIFKLLIKYAKLEQGVEFYPWSRAYNIAENRPNTVIFSMVRTKEREDKFTWLIKVSGLVRAFISKKSIPQNYVNSIEQAKTKSVVAVRDSYSHNSLIKNGFSENKNLYLVASIEEAISLFEQNKVELIYTDPNVVKNYYLALKRKADNLIHYVLLPETRRDGYIAINKNSDSILIKKLQKAAAQIELLESYQHFLNYKPLLNWFN